MRIRNPGNNILFAGVRTPRVTSLRGPCPASRTTCWCASCPWRTSTTRASTAPSSSSMCPPCSSIYAHTRSSDSFAVSATIRYGNDAGTAAAYLYSCCLHVQLPPTGTAAAYTYFNEAVFWIRSDWHYFGGSGPVGTHFNQIKS
jgi:hypothetical protein